MFVSLQSGAILVDPHIFRVSVCVCARVCVSDSALPRSSFVLAPVSPLHFVKICSAFFAAVKIMPRSQSHIKEGKKSGFRVKMP